MRIRKLGRAIVAIAGATALFIAVASPALASWHIVQSGETLSVIAGQYGVGVDEIVSANEIVDPNVIHVGQELWIPDDGVVAPDTGGAAVIHVVVAGETLGGIASMYGVDTVTLATTNAIPSPYIIFPGQELTVPYQELPIQPVVPPNTGSINIEIPYVDRDVVKGAIIDLAIAYGWDPYLILSQAWQESTWDQRALSPAGAVGVMQLLPSTADWAGPALVGRTTDYLYNAWDNIETGIAYLTNLRSITGSDYLALASYYQGLASVERDGIFPETRDYALGIIESRDLFASGALP